MCITNGKKQKARPKGVNLGAVLPTVQAGSEAQMAINLARARRNETPQLSATKRISRNEKAWKNLTRLLAAVPTTQGAKKA